METITLSKRGFTVFKRYVETKFEEVVKKAKEATEDSEEPVAGFSYPNGWRLILDYSCACHRDEDCVVDGDNIMAYGEECDKCNYYPTHILIGLQYKRAESWEWKIMACKEFQVKTVKLEMLLDWLDYVEETKNKWTFCRYQCGDLATMNGACERCYIHSYVRSEEEGGDCCVCRENDGRWVKIRCGHILHYHCFMKIPPLQDGTGNRKCPMCRELCSFAKSHIDCYDV